MNKQWSFLKKLAQTEEEVDKKSQSFRTQLRAMKDELNALEEAGLENTKRFTDLSVAAAHLEDQIGDTNARIRAMASDSFVFDALVSGMQGVAGAFAVGQGAAALFGDTSDELQQTLIKVNASMAVLQGLQQIQNLIADQSIALTGVEVALQKIRVLQTELDTAAQSKNIAIRYAAIVAQKALNLVMSLSPAGVLLAAIAGVAGALLYFTSNTNKALEEQQRFNDELKNELDLLGGINKELSRPYQDRVTTLQNELTVLKEHDVAQSEILKKEKQLLLAQQDLANFNSGFYSDQVNSLGEVSAKLETQKQKLKQLKDELSTTEKGGFLEKWFTNNRGVDDIKKEIKVVEDGITNLETSQTNGINVRNAALQTQADLEAKNAAIAKYNREQFIKSAVSGSEAVVAKEIEGTRAALQAELRAIEVKKDADLQNVNLTEGEREKIRAVARQSEAKAQYDFDQRQLDTSAKAIDSRANLEYEGTRKRLSMDLQSLDILKAKELQEYVVVNGEQIRIKQLTEKQKSEIDDRYFKLRVDKTNATNKQIAEDEISTNIANIQSKISALELEGSSADKEKLLQLKKDLVTEEAFLSVTSLTFDEKNEQKRAALIEASNAKQLAEKKQLERDKIQAEITSSLNNQNAYEQLQADRDQRILNNSKATLKQKTKAEDDYFIHSQNILQNQLDAEGQYYDNGLISYEDYQTKKLQIQDQTEALSMQKTQTAEAKKQAIMSASLALFSTLSAGFFDSLKSYYDQDLQNVQDLQSKKLISQDEADKRTKTIKRAQAVADKEQALFNIAISTAQAIARDLAGNKALIPFDIATGLAEAAFVIARPLPKFKSGKVKINGPGTETSDSIPALLSKNESVINAAATRKYQPALEAINSLTFEAYLAKLQPPKTQMAMFEFPTMGPLPKWAEQQHRGTIINKFNAKEVGEEVAKAIKQMPGFTFSFDERGAIVYMHKHEEETRFLNKKYSFSNK